MQPQRAAELGGRHRRLRLALERRAVHTAAHAGLPREMAVIGGAGSVLEINAGSMHAFWVARDH